MGFNRQPLEIPARCGLTVPSSSLQAITGAERSARLTCLLARLVAISHCERVIFHLKNSDLTGLRTHDYLPSAWCGCFCSLGERYIAVGKNEYSGYLNDGGQKHLSTGTARKRLYLRNLTPMGAHVENGLTVVAGVLS